MGQKRPCLIVSIFVVLTGLVGCSRRSQQPERTPPEMLLRSVGAAAAACICVLLLEACQPRHGRHPSGFVGLLYLGLWIGQPLITLAVRAMYSITPPGYMNGRCWGAIYWPHLMGSVPAWRAYRQSLVDGLSIRT